MRRIILFVLLLAGIVNAQYSGLYWGKKGNSKITIGSSFTTTDSLRIRAKTNQLSNSTGELYSDLIYFDSRQDGVGVITISLDSLNSPMDSAATIWWRYYDDKDVHPNHFWDIWYQIGSYHKTDTLYIYNMTDFSWWRPARGAQIKFIKYDKDNDTCYVNLGFYSN